MLPLPEGDQLAREAGRREGRPAGPGGDRRVLFVGWSVYQTQANTNGNAANAAEAKRFAAEVQDCQERLITAIVESRKVTAINERISADNDRLSKEERTLLADLAKAQSEWLGQLIAPTDPRIAALDPNDAAREEYSFSVSRVFFKTAGDINRRIEAIHSEQEANERDRPTSRPALPDPKCGE